VPVCARSVSDTGRAKASPPDEILRFRKSERQLHWAVAAPLIVSLTTATILVAVYNLHPGWPYRAVFSWTHRISGVCLFFLPLLTVMRHRKELGIYVDNTRQAWFWTLNDVKWLFLMGPASMCKKISLPHQGKFNAAEKINYMVLTLTYPCYIVTGVLIWLPGVALVAWLLHFSMAMIATPLIMGHIFMATINPETRVGLTGMISGFVDRQWAKHHYRLWYDQHFGHAEVVASVARVGESVAEIAPPPARPDVIDNPPAETEAPSIAWARPLGNAEPAPVLGPRPGADIEPAFVSASDHETDQPVQVLEPDALPPTAPSAGAKPHPPRARRSEERRAALRPRPRFEAPPLSAEVAVWPPIAHVASEASAEDTTQ
jgi:formate dehydrogenase subunit gamma